jgi:pilus assembly protein CpaE
MLRGIIISPDTELSARLESFLSETGHIGVVRSLDHYPNSLELTRFLRANAPQVIFLGVDSLGKAAELAAGVEEHTPGVQIVAMHRSCEPQMLLEVMRLGIREFFAYPFARDNYRDMVGRLADALEKRPAAHDVTDLVFSFLPAKAGVGTSTVALNTGAAMARQPNTNVLLSDFDMNSGMIRFMLKLDNLYSVVDAAEHAATLDENLWPQLVTHFDRLDVLHAGKLNPNFRIEPIQIRHLLDFARRNYQAVCVDLSGNLEKYSLEIMQESKRIFLVCTPEIPSLHLAREKLQYLQSLDLGSRVSLVLNRAQRRSSINAEQIEQLLRIPVHATFPNDYHGVQRALQEGKVVDPSSELGKQFSQLARQMLSTKNPAKEDAKEKRTNSPSFSPSRRAVFSCSRTTRRLPAKPDSPV